MADYFNTLPSFVNPDYASPEQLAQQRSYADMLMKRSGQDVTRPTGAIANTLDAVTAGLTRNYVNALQNQMAQANARDLSAVISQLQSGQKPDAATLARVYANPMASPEHRALIDALVKPQAVNDVYGNPAYASPSSGVQPAPIAGRPGGFQPGYRVHQGAEGVSTDAPIPAPTPAAGPPVMAPRAPVPSTSRMWGDKEAEAAGLYPTPPGGGGGPAPAAGSPPAAAPAIPNRPLSLDELAAKGREFAAERERTQGGAKAEGEVIQKDVNRAAAAPETLKGLGIMRNTIQSVGDKMTFGPTAKFSNEARRVISNYAPGLVDEKALAGADAVEKLNLGLAGNLSQQLGLNPSDIYRSVASVPGNEKSKEGTLALISMMEQQARNDQYVGSVLYQQHRGNLAGYQAARSAYYANHPIVNPITGNPIEIDAKRAGVTGGGYEKTATNPTTGEKIGLRNGKWEPIR